MLTRRWMAVTVAALAFVGAGGSASAAERALLGIVLGRSYRQVLSKFGTPNRVQPVMIPVPGQQTAGAYDPNNPAAPGGSPGYGAPGAGGPGYGAPGYGAPGGDTGGGPPGYGGAPSYGPPGGGSTGGGPPGYGGAPSYGPPGGGSTGGGPPVLPPVGGGAPGGPGYGGYGDQSAGGAGGLTVTGVGNGAEWIYNRPGGVTLAFIINEDGRVAQISVSSSRPYPAARTSRGVGLGADYSKVLMKYGYPERQLVGGYFVEAYYPKNHHAAFTFVRGKLVRTTIALAD